MGEASPIAGAGKFDFANASKTFTEEKKQETKESAITGGKFDLSKVANMGQKGREDQEAMDFGRSGKRSGGQRKGKRNIGDFLSGAHPSESRRLVGSALCTDEDVPHGMFIFAPILLILMLVLFMYRKPVQAFFADKASASYKGLRFIQKMAPVRHSL